MFRPLTLLSFLGLTSSILVGSSIYKNEYDNLEISNLVTNNKASSLITKFTKTSKDLNEVKSEINKLDDDLSNFESSWKSNQDWRSGIWTHTSENTKKDKYWRERINKKEEELNRLNTYSTIKDQNKTKFESLISEWNNRVENLNKRILKNESDSKKKYVIKNNQKQQEYKDRIEQLKKLLQEAEEKVKAWQKALDEYKSKKEKIETKINKNKTDQNAIQNGKAKTQEYLAIANKNQEKTENATDEIASDISIIQKEISNLKTKQNELIYEKNQLQSNIFNIQKS